MGIMGLKKYDIVYLVKDTPENDELKYSLRSICQNLPHHKVWLIGGCPTFIDKAKINHVYIEQNSRLTKWNNTNKLLMSVCDNENISDDFVLFNDDFFATKPLENIPCYYDRTLADRINDFALKYPYSRYVFRLKQTLQTLQRHGINEPLNFELHTPMLFNKTKLKELYRHYGDSGSKRTIYGNLYYKDQAIQHPDVKCYNIYHCPASKDGLVSTTDASFRLGLVGKTIRNRFKQPCKYEMEENNERRFVS